MTEFPTFRQEPKTTPFSIEGVMVDGLRLVTCGVHSVEPEEPSIVQKIEEKRTELEAKKMFLHQQGLLPNTAEGRREYERRKASNSLCDIRAVQLALTDIPRAISATLTKDIKQARRCVWVHTSYGLKLHLEKYRSFNGRRGYITDGDFAMAMLLLGYPIRKSRENPQCLSFRCVSLMEVDTGRGYCKYIDDASQLIHKDDSTV